MVVIDNKKDNDSDNKDNPDIPKDNKEVVSRYTINPKEMPFPIEGLKNARVVKEGEEDDPNPTMKEIEKDAELTKQVTKTPEQIKAEELERAAYDDKDLKFIHLPNDPAYTPISIELIKLNEFQNEDLKINTRIMMNLALSDYVIFRRIDDDDNLVNFKITFRRIKTHQFQEYVDLQTEVDDLVKRVGIIEMTYPFTMELQDQLYETQKRLLKVARERIRKGFDVFFKWENQKIRDEVFEDADNNDVTFNVDSAFIRLTKSPFLRRKSSPSS